MLATTKPVDDWILGLVTRSTASTSTLLERALGVGENVYRRAHPEMATDLIQQRVELLSIVLHCYLVFSSNGLLVSPLLYGHMSTLCSFREGMRKRSRCANEGWTSTKRCTA